MKLLNIFVSIALVYLRGTSAFARVESKLKEGQSQSKKQRYVTVRTRFPTNKSRQEIEEAVRALQLMLAPGSEYGMSNAAAPAAVDMNFEDRMGENVNSEADGEESGPIGQSTSQSVAGTVLSSRAARIGSPQSMPRSELVSRPQSVLIQGGAATAPASSSAGRQEQIVDAANSEQEENVVRSNHVSAARQSVVSTGGQSILSATGGQSLAVTSAYRSQPVSQSVDVTSTYRSKPVSQSVAVSSASGTQPTSQVRSAGYGSMITAAGSSNSLRSTSRRTMRESSSSSTTSSSVSAVQLPQSTVASAYSINVVPGSVPAAQGRTTDFSVTIRHHKRNGQVISKVVKSANEQLSN